MTPRVVDQVLGLAAVALLLGCSAGHRITRFAPETPIDKGDQAAYYALPRTLVQVTMAGKRVELADGDDPSCFDFLATDADWVTESPKPKVWKVVGLDAAPTRAPMFGITGAPALGTAAEPDPQQIFRADLGSSAWIKRKLELMYGPLGVLQSGSSVAQDTRINLAVAVFKTALQGVMLGILSVRQPPFTFTTVRPASPCERAARAIAEAREAIDGLPAVVTTGALTHEQATWLETRLRQKVESNLALLLKRKETTVPVVCVVRPVVGDELYDVLRIDKAVGFAAGDEANCMIPAELAGKAVEGSLYRLAVHRYEEQLSEALRAAGVAAAHDDAEPQGFYYRVPAMARIRLDQVTRKDGDQVVASAAAGDFVISQLGIVAALPAQRTMQTQYDVTLDPATGALQKLASASEAVDKGVITDVQGALGDAFAARAEARKAAATTAAAAADELALLERERKLLEERKKIRDLRAELGDDPP